MKILHIQDAWEIPKFMQELSKEIAEGAIAIIDVTDIFQDDTFHFLVSKTPLSPKECEESVAAYWKEQDDGEDI